MQLTSVGFPGGNRPKLQAIKPLTTSRGGVRFGDDDDQAEKPKKKKIGRFSKLAYKSLLHSVAYSFTHPKKVLKFQGFFSKRIRNRAPSLPSILQKFHPVQKVKLTSLDNVQLQGYWMPSHSPSDKTVILGHGYTHDARSMFAVAEQLRKSDYNAFLFDFRAHGESEGDKTSIGYHESKDIAAAVDYMKKFYPMQSKKLFYLGYSMGAASMMNAPKSLEKFPDALKGLTRNVDGIVLDGSYANLLEMTDRFVNHYDQLKTSQPFFKTLQQRFATKFKHWGKQLVEDFANRGQQYMNLDIPYTEVKPPELFKDHDLAKKPILILHGTEDSVIPFSHGQKVYDTLKDVNPDIQFIPMAGSDHGGKWDPFGKGEQYTTSKRGTIMDHLLAFFKKHGDKNP